MKPLLALIITVSLYADNKLFVMLASIHHTMSEVRTNKNDLNLGLGYEYTHDTGLGVQIGGYYNSYYKPTAFAGVHYQYEIFKDWKTSLSLSGATGYEEVHRYAVIPMALVGLQYKSIRIVTNTPFALFTTKNAVTNIQFVYEF